MVARIEFKKNIANICSFYFIIGKFGYWQELSLVILFIINKCLKIKLYNIVLFFNITINLKIKSNYKLLSNF